MMLPAFAAVPAMSAGTWLSQQQPGGGNGNGDGGGQGADFGKSSPVGLLLLLVFFIAVAFLIRSMTKHLKRLPKTFDTDAETRTAQAPATEARAARAEPGGADEAPRTKAHDAEPDSASATEEAAAQPRE